MSIMIYLTLLESANKYAKYLFRVCPSSTPFGSGTWSQQNPDALKEWDKKHQFLYTSPALYCWIQHYFREPKVEHVYVFNRPDNMNPHTTMACGVNSVWPYTLKTQDKKTINHVRKCIIDHQFEDPVILKLTEELNERVMKKWGKPLNKMKGGTYLGTLHDWDTGIQKNGYPEVIVSKSDIKKCYYEELICKNKTTFIGKETGKIFKLEFPV